MTNADEDKLLIVSARDVQVLVGLHALFSTLICEDATPAQAAQNVDTLARLFTMAYSANEANALGVRLCALLPTDTALVVSTPATRAARAAQSAHLQ